MYMKQAVVYHEACEQSKQTEQSTRFAMETVHRLLCAAPQGMRTGAGKRMHLHRR